MIISIDAVPKSFVGLKPYLYYTIMCTDVIDTKQRLLTKFKLDYKDGVRFVIIINDVINAGVIDVSDPDEKRRLLTWLTAVDENKGFYLRKTYVSDISFFLSNPKTEEKFVRVGNDYFTEIINMISLM